MARADSRTIPLAGTMPLTGVSSEPPGQLTLASFFERRAPDIRSGWAWDNYRPTIEAFVREMGLTRLLEIGGGRSPLFTLPEAQELGVTLTVNDISEEELRNAPEGFDTACFDISDSGAVTDERKERHDLIFSRMVFEHVKDVRTAWSNVRQLLAPGGVGIAFIPTLYALPYVANMAIPEAVSSRVVKLLYPHRTDDSEPKFPAHYDWAFSDERKLRPMLEGVGFSDVHIVPFYGHDYFAKLPVLREADEMLTRLAIRRDWRSLTAYAYIVARR